MTGGRKMLGWAGFVAVVASMLAWPAEIVAAEPAVTRAQLEADWSRQLELRYPRIASPGGNVTVEADAAGAVDGV